MIGIILPKDAVTLSITLILSCPSGFLNRYRVKLDDEFMIDIVDHLLINITLF